MPAQPGAQCVQGKGGFRVYGLGFSVYLAECLGGDSGCCMFAVLQLQTVVQLSLLRAVRLQANADATDKKY